MIFLNGGTMQCSRCDKKAIIKLKYAELNLCKDCFIEFFEKRVAKTVGENRYLYGVKSIAVALSGGKDSTAILYILNKMLKNKRIKLFAITIDGGIKGYDDLLLKNAKAVCKKLGITLHVFTLKKEFGFGLDKIARARPKLCNCGIFRRYILNKKARELKADKLATGHNLDDEDESIIMNLIRGDVGRIARGEGIIKDKRFVPRIKPLQRSPENDVLLYAKLIFPKLKFGYGCPYRNRVLRYNIKNMIDALEKEHSGIKFQIFEGNKKIREALLKSVEKGKIGKPNICKACGEIAAGEICQACKLKEEIKDYLSRS